MLKRLAIYKKYRFIASGSLLGVTLKDVELFPGGYVDIQKMYQLDFEEFLWSQNIKEDLLLYLKDCYNSKKDVLLSVHNNIIDLFKRYLIVRGFPDSINVYN